jgi:hypothetical protein
LRSFSHFIQWVEGQMDLVAGTPGLTQSSRIAAACGPSRAPDFVLHAERADQDWAAMLQHYNLPRVALPHLHDRASHTGEARDSYSSAPVAELTPEVIATINRIDAPMFDDFNYTMMQAPQVASVAASRLVSVKAEIIGALGGSVVVLFLMVLVLLALLVRTGHYRCCCCGCGCGCGRGGGGDGGGALWRWLAAYPRGGDRCSAFARSNSARMGVMMSSLRSNRGSQRLSAVEDCERADERADERAADERATDERTADERTADEWAKH